MEFDVKAAKVNIISLALAACAAATAFSAFAKAPARQAACASQGVRKAAGCRVEWDGAWMKVGNALFCREYVVSNGVLRTVSFKAVDGRDWQAEAARWGHRALPVAVEAEAAKWSPVGVEGLRVKVVAEKREMVLWLFPGVPGVIVQRAWTDAVKPVHDRDRDFRNLSEDGKALRSALDACDCIRFAPQHIKATSVVCMDQTDIRDKLMDVDERLLMAYDTRFTLAASALDCRDVLSGDGMAFVRLAPMPSSRPEKVEDFILDGAHRRVGLLANGYPLVELVYRGGDAGRQRALVAFQRAIRPYQAGRDGILLSNTWGGGNHDTRINQAFLVKEIEAGAKIGVDVIQIDDGWEHGRTSNSERRALDGKKKVWNGYWASDPDFWKEDRERFPDGLDFLVKKAAEKGMRFGLWFGPDSSDDAANWQRDADCLIDYHRRLGIDYFKLDSLKLFTPLALKRNRMMFDRMLEASGGAMVFDLDCTAEIRPGFLGLLDVGPMFVENRYTTNPVYWPHHTLKNLWDLSHLIDPVRLRMEFNNPDTNHGKYGGSPLCHGKYRPDALFATVMAASPLAWMELSDVSEKSVAALAPIVKTWKAERERWHGGVIHPVGSRPDGVAWTGFVSEAADGAGGYALLFRELNASERFTLDLAPIFGDCPLSVEGVIGGRGEAAVEGSRLTVSVPETLDFLWVKIGRSGKDVPELLVSGSGERIATSEQWERLRRPEIAQTLLEQEYGVRPIERPADLAFSETAAPEACCGGKALRKRVRATYSGPGGTGEINFSVWIPRRDVPVPAFIHSSPRPAETADDPNGPHPVYLLPVEDIVSRGFAVIAYCNQDVAADWTGTDVATSGVFKVFGPRDLKNRASAEWGILSAWAWGMSRILDWVETEPLLDAKRVAAVGLSRNGKAALVAGAFDARFAMTVSCCSGCSGAKLNHMPVRGAERIRDIMVAAKWFCPNYAKYIDREMEMPFDQHWLLALVAPRLLYVSSATDDAWAGPGGEFAALALASPAWKLHGVQGLVSWGFPQADAPLHAGNAAYHVRTGGHAITRDDWRHYMDFAEAHGWKDAFCETGRQEKSR